MDIHNLRQQLKTRSIYDLPLRVTFYARVSSESDEQLNSLGNQITYYEDLIRKNAHWVFVPGYIDEGLSAATTKKRENFNRMIDDAARDQFDLIITKEISRFARNTLDSIQFTRQLLSCGVGVFFQNDNINTLDEDSELRLSIMSSIAQDELRKLSSRVKFGHQQAIREGVVLGNSRIFGYVKDGGRLVIDETEAPMIRELFALYASGAYSMKQLEALFWEKGYRNHNGKKIAHTTMSGLIANPKYKGYYVGNKVKVVDLFTKKQKFLPPEEWVMFRDETGEIVPAIVSEEVWDAANAVLKKRSEDVKNRQGICNHANLLTGKLYCTHCGAAYYRRESVDRQGSKNSRWVCSGKIKNGADACPSFAVYESELKPLLLEVFRLARPQLEALIEEYIQMYKQLHQGDSLNRRMEALRGTMDTIQKKKQKLLSFNAQGALSDRDFLDMNAQCTAELEAAEKELAELTAQRSSAADFKQKIDTIRQTLRDAQQDAAQGLINKEFVDKYIDKIYATPETDNTLHLQIKLSTGAIVDKTLENLRSRTGHTFNNGVAPAEGQKADPTSGTVEINRYDGKIENNYGTVKLNDGTNSGSPTINNNYGLVEENKGAKVITNQAGGTIQSNSGLVGKKNEDGYLITDDTSGNYGIVTNNKAGGEVCNREGAEVTNNYRYGTVNNDGGKVTNNLGIVTNSGGEVTENNAHGIVYNYYDGKVTNNNARGIVYNYGGEVTNNYRYGTVNNDGGKVTNNWGTVTNSDGTVVNNNADGTVNNNGGTVTNNSGTVKNNGGTVKTNNIGGVVKEYSDQTDTVETNYGTHEIYGSSASGATPTAVYYGVHFEDKDEKVYLGSYQNEHVVTFDELNSSAKEKGYKITSIETVQDYDRQIGEFGTHNEAAPQNGDGAEETPGTTTGLPSFKISAPTRLTLLWEKIASIFTPAASTDSSSGGAEVVELSARKRYIGLGSVIFINEKGYKVVEIKDDAFVVVSYDALSDEDVKDLNALYAKLFTPEQQKLIKNVGQLLDSEDVLAVFGTPGNHPVYEISKDLVK